MKYRSVFDIIGPIMIGPSSSHTAGAARIGLMARQILGSQPVRIDILLLGSFAKTYKGHGTDIAVVGGILGFTTFDKRIVDALDIAKDLGIQICIHLSQEQPNHPNTVQISLHNENELLWIEGISIGGGKIEITGVDHFSIRLTGEAHTLLIWHDDRCGMVACVSQILAGRQTNIGYMQVARKSKGDQALMVIETDVEVTSEVCEEIRALKHIGSVKSIPALP